MATAPSPNDLTRQQLDELDALLQRMLALPLNPSDAQSSGGLTPPAAPTPGPAGLPLPDAPVANWRVDPPAPAPAPAPHLLAAPIPVDPPRSRPPEPEPRPPVAPDPVPAPVVRAPVAPEPPPATRPPQPPPAPVPPPEPKAAPVPVLRARESARPAPSPPTPTPTPVAQESPTPSRPAAPPLPVALWPLVALNWVVDVLLGLLGPPGRVLRTEAGKNLLGLTGIGLLTYTAAHVAQQQGWMTLPVALPWPR